ncbi:hypothetical protein [Marichromatium gracile]|uniref:Zinc ribbon protein n=1 Tax=Marichromatium gracile TaxID=1048 RepID=A0ABR5VF51_MARGR|nr:hypothetical protein [Marichromatium gracile]KXX64204.1 hypothetical protein AY586_14750 [Marichromatium gracile]
MHPDTDTAYAEHDYRADQLASCATKADMLAKFPGADGPQDRTGIDYEIWDLGHGLYAGVCECGHVWEHSWQTETHECPNCATELAESMDGVELLAESCTRLNDADLAKLARDVDHLRDRLRAEVHLRVERRHAQRQAVLPLERRAAA